MLQIRNFRFATLLAVLAIAFSSIAVDYAEARRGGGFGSRGARTFQSAPPTATAPTPGAPLQRSMTPAGQAAPAAGTAAAARQGARPGFMNGLGGNLMRGLFIGGLFGLLMGAGFGGFAGMLGLLFQIALIGGAIYLLMRFLRRRQQPAVAGAGHAGHGQRTMFEGLGGAAGGSGRTGGSVPRNVRGAGAAAAAASTMPGQDALGITQADLDTFERMLREIQEAFGREDYAALRERTTPEIMSYLSEELGQNASRGVKNEVSDVRLLQGDVAESWKEGSREYATVAMRYASVDALRDRTTGEVVEGDADQASETTEIWTFIRDWQEDWKLSAIQDA